MTPDSFARLLSETITWITCRVGTGDLRTSFRSDELRPTVDAIDQFEFGFFNDSRYIHDVLQKRSRLLRGLKLVSADEFPPGRILLTEYGMTNHNRATEFETAGFFDWADNPPWDLWIGETSDMLVCWIPQEFVELVDRADAVECMNMFCWADNPKSHFTVPDWLGRFTIRTNKPIDPSGGSRVF